MADDRFVVHEHFVIDRKQRRYAPFGEHAGAGVVADQLNADPDFARVFVWSDGDPRKQTSVKRSGAVDDTKADEARREKPAS